MDHAQSGVALATLVLSLAANAPGLGIDNAVGSAFADTITGPFGDSVIEI